MYTWSEVSDATVYYLLVYPLDEPSIYLIDTWYLSGQVCTGSTCAIRSDLRLGYGTYNWLVQTWNAAGFGPWSDAKKFIVSPATPTRTPTLTRTPTSTRTPTPAPTAVPTLAVVGTLNVFGSTQSIAVRGNYAYLGLGNIFKIVDISTPTAPLEKGNLDLTSYIHDIAVPDPGNYAYVATDLGLKVVDISTPATPFSVGTGFPGATYGVAVIGTTAYLVQSTSGFKGLKVVNVGSPVPAELGSYAMAYAYDVAAGGTSTYVYVANGGDGFYIINISTPAAPSSAGFLKPSGSAIKIASKGNYAYTAYGSKGLRVFSVINPSAPSLIGSFETLGDALAVDVYTFSHPNYYVYVAAGSSGVWVFRFNESSPANPIAVGLYNTTPVNAQDVVVDGNEIYIANGTEGLLILEFIP